MRLFSGFKHFNIKPRYFFEVWMEDNFTLLRHIIQNNSKQTGMYAQQSILIWKTYVDQCLRSHNVGSFHFYNQNQHAIPAMGAPRMMPTEDANI